MHIFYFFEKIIAEIKVITITEKKVINPNPLPVRPKISCSSGDLLATKIITKFNKNIEAKINNFFMPGLLKEFLKFLIALGTKNIAKQNKIIFLGIIIESLFMFGVMTRVIAIDPETKILKSLCCPAN